MGHNMLQIEKKTGNQVTQEEGKESEMRSLIKLEGLEKEILTLKGKERDSAIKTYRELLCVLKDKPIYLLRY